MQSVLFVRAHVASHMQHVWYAFTSTGNCIITHLEGVREVRFFFFVLVEHKTYIFSPGEHDGNEPEILATVLDELILELQGTQDKTHKIKK